MNISQILSTPYVLEVESVENANGEWVCLATYSELPNCIVQDVSPLIAIDKLEEKRLMCIFSLIEQGEEVPVPRRYFKDRYFGISSEPVDMIMKRLGLEQWLERLEMEVPVSH